MGLPATRSHTTTSCCGSVCARKKRFGKRSPPNTAFFITCLRLFFADIWPFPLRPAALPKQHSGLRFYCMLFPSLVQQIFAQCRLHLRAAATHTPGLIVTVNDA